MATTSEHTAEEEYEQKEEQREGVAVSPP